IHGTHQEDVISEETLAALHRVADIPAEMVDAFRISDHLVFAVQARRAVPIKVIKDLNHGIKLLPVTEVHVAILKAGIDIVEQPDNPLKFSNLLVRQSLACFLDQIRHNVDDPFNSASDTVDVSPRVSSPAEGVVVSCFGFRSLSAR